MDDFMSTMMNAGKGFELIEVEFIYIFLYYLLL